MQTRLLSLDAMRGLAVIGMIMVVSPGDWGARYDFLQHADWQGWTAADMVFPLFLFSVGVSMVPSFLARFGRGQSRAAMIGHIVRRAALLIVLGILFNGALLGMLHSGPLGFDWAHLRLPGVLQRVGLCYAAAGLIFVGLCKGAEDVTRKLGFTLAAIVVAILALYWALLAFVPTPGFGAGRFDSWGSLPAYLDRQVFGLDHLWFFGTTPDHGVTYDPEGLLSTLPAVATVLIGVLCGLWLRLAADDNQRLLGMAGAGVMLFVAGYIVSPFIPIIKRLWTDSFVLVSGGVALLVFSALYAMIDLWRKRAWSYPLRVFGANAILGYALNELKWSLTDAPLFHGSGGATIHALVFTALTDMIADHRLASLAFAAANVAAIGVVLAVLYQGRIFVRA